MEQKLIANWCKFGFFFEFNEENLFVYLLNFFNSASGQFRALLRFRADCRGNRGIATRSADSNECACWPGSSQEGSARKVFPYTRKRRLSRKQQAGHARWVF
jgi:hypothetical protein